MQLKKITALIAIVVAITFTGIAPMTAQASGYLNGNSYAKQAKRHVRITKTVKVYRVHTGKYEAANRFIKTASLKKGQSAYISANIMSTGGWIIKNKQHKANKRNFYLVSSSNHRWYRTYSKTKQKQRIVLKHHATHPVLYRAPSGQFIN